jgi:hypothetical protein
LQRVRLLIERDAKPVTMERRAAVSRRCTTTPLFPWLLLVLAAAGCGHVDVLALPAPLWAEPLKQQRPAPVFAFEDASLRIDQLQTKGSHNSYHRAPRWSVLRGFRYSHAPLEVQLQEQGVRHLELDVRYANGELRVGHAPIIDARATCVRFHDCIRQVKHWSKAHPLHVPVFVFVQPKEGLVGAELDDRLELLDREIGRVFSRHDLIIPSDIAQGFPSLRKAVMERGWPSLSSTRGKVAFVLFGQGRLVAKYARGRPCLEGRRMFAAQASAGAPHAVVLSIDNPVARQDDILRAVRDHLLVRTRADADARRDLRRRNAAITSGAHFIGSDFVDPELGWLDIGPEAPARENRITGRASRRGQRVVEMERAVWTGLQAREANSSGGATRVR